MKKCICLVEISTSNFLFRSFWSFLEFGSSFEKRMNIFGQIKHDLPFLHQNQSSATVPFFSRLRCNSFNGIQLRHLKAAADLSPSKWKLVDIQKCKRGKAHFVMHILWNNDVTLALSITVIYYHTTINFANNHLGKKTFRSKNF